MKLEGKKSFAARVLGVGEGRIIFNNKRLDEIKEAMTRQDIKDLEKDGAILIREIKGRRKLEKRRNRRRKGSIKKVIKNKKRAYINLTRKLRNYIGEFRRKELITKEHYYLLRKEIKAKIFKNKIHLKERMKLLK